MDQRSHFRRPRGPGRRVRIVAPSSPFDRARLERGVAILETRGFVVDVPDDVLVSGHAYLNGDDEHRRTQLSDALADDNVDIIWMARGGYGLTRIVDDVVIPHRPAPLVVGFSDVTALTAKLTCAGHKSVHGPLATTLSGESEASLDHLFALLDGAVDARAAASLSTFPLHTVATHDVDGWTFAANLCVLSHLAGTASLPTLNGAILFLEEVGERPYRIDRMLTQLIRSGALRDVSAVVTGHLTNCDEPENKNAPTARAVVDERMGAIGVPVFRGLPFGHDQPNFAIPNGCRARISLDDGRGRLSILESLFDDDASSSTGSAPSS